MKHSKQILSILLVLLMLCTCVPSAFGADIVANGTCGDSLTWTLDSEDTLTISGTGSMMDFDYDFDEANEVYRTAAPWGAYYSTIKTVLIGDGVTSIGTCAFYRCVALESVTIPGSVTSIGNNAFNDCKSLADASIPASVKNIGEEAFYFCSSLKSVTIPDGVTSISKGAFRECSALESVTIPDSVTTIGEGAFQACTSLKSVTIPDGVTSIGYAAFDYCESLTSVTIPASVTSIGEEAFDNCSPDLEISCYDGSYAQQYANDNGYKVNLIAPKLNFFQRIIQWFRNLFAKMFSWIKR